MENLVNKMVTIKSKTVRHDWSDDNASNLNVHDFDSIADNQDMQSIVSQDADKTGGGPSNQLQQNSLFSSIHGGQNQTNNQSLNMSIGGEK